jgi:Methyltransferase domain
MRMAHENSVVNGFLITTPLKRVLKRILPEPLWDRLKAVRDVRRNLRAIRDRGSGGVSHKYPNQDYPALEANHVENARLFANREDLISSMGFMEGGVVAEIGVAQGNFSEYLLTVLRPRKFVAFDTFAMHEYPMHWGVPSSKLFDNMTHLEFYKRKFSDRSAQVVLEVGLSNEKLAIYPDECFDLIYIDADHSYEAVKQDSDLAKRKLRHDGIIVYNDYMMFDHLFAQEPYGVVQVVNEIIVKEDWRVYGFAFGFHMFCDIAIRRSDNIRPF